MRMQVRKVARFLSIFLLASVVIVCSFKALIYWLMDPENRRAPSDQALITEFQKYHLGFEDQSKITLGFNNPKSLALPPILAIGKNHDGGIRYVFAEGGVLATGPGWAKGIQYVPGTGNPPGEILPNLDNARLLPSNVYFRSIEPHWYIFYQRDDN